MSTSNLKGANVYTPSTLLHHPILSALLTNALNTELNFLTTLFTWKLFHNSIPVGTRTWSTKISWEKLVSCCVWLRLEVMPLDMSSESVLMTLVSQIWMSRIHKNFGSHYTNGAYCIPSCPLDELWHVCAAWACVQLPDTQICTQVKRRQNRQGISLEGVRESHGALWQKEGPECAI